MATGSFWGGAVRSQVPPLRYAPVGMTSEGVAVLLGVVAEAKRFSKLI